MKILAEKSAEDFLEKEGFDIVRRKTLKTYEQARSFASQIGYPVVLKIASDKLLHKTDANAVRLNVAEESLKKEFNSLNKTKVQKQGITMQKHLTGKEILLGIKKDDTFGHIIVAGLGGIYTEIIKDVSLRIAPIKRSDAEEMLKELKSYKILQGFRGEKIDAGKIVDNIMKLNSLAKKHPNIRELDINPLIINNKEAVVVDARIVFE